MIILTCARKQTSSRLNQSSARHHKLTRSSATTVARDAHVAAHSLSLLSIQCRPTTCVH